MTTEFVKTLITAGIVNGAQVERAMHYESGSSLVERLLSLGYGNENDFHKVLKNKLKKAVVEESDLSDIKEDCLKIFPVSIIEKHHVLPFFMDSSVLRLAMFDPTLTTVVDELTDFTKKNNLGEFNIEAYGVLPSNLAKALNKYYKLGLPEMFKYGKETLIENYNGPKIPALRLTKDEDMVKLPPLPPKNEKKAADGVKSKLIVTNSDELSKLPPLPQNSNLSAKEKPEMVLSDPNIAENAQEKESEKVKTLKPGSEGLVRKMNEEFDKLSEMVACEEISEKTAPKKTQDTKLNLQTEVIAENPKTQIEKADPSKMKQENIIKQEDDFDSNPACPIDPQNKDITESMTEGLNYDEEVPEFKDIKDLVPEKPSAVSKDDVTSASIESASTKEEIIKNTLKELRKLSSRCLILFVRNDVLSAVLGEGSGIVENYEGYTIPLVEPSIFKDVFESGEEYYGPLNPNPLLDSFMTHFGNQKPMSVTLVPSIIEEQVFAILYTEETPTVEEVKNIAKSMATAFEKLLV